MTHDSLHSHNCEWLAPEGPYRALAQSLRAADPRLGHRDVDSEKNGVPWPGVNPKALVLRCKAVGGFMDPSTYTNAEALREALSPAKPSGPKCRTVVILEGLSPEFIEVLGIHYGIHPAMFAEHERSHLTKACRRLEPAADLPLPASVCTRDYVALAYAELVRLPYLRNGGFRAYCAATDRHVGVTRAIGKVQDVGMARRKCAVWHRQNTEQDSWDCKPLSHYDLQSQCVLTNPICPGLVLCDPPIESIRCYDDDALAVVKMPQPPSSPCGYIDFTPLQHQMERKSGPPRTSMAADLVFYLRSAEPLLDLTTPACVTTLVAKIVASHFLMPAGYLREIMSNVEFDASYAPHLAGLQIADAEAQWSDAQTLCRRAHEYLDNLEANMLQLRVPFAAPDTSRVAGWEDFTADFQFLRLRFQALRTRAEMISHSRAGLASIAGNRQAERERQLALLAAERSVNEARRARALTVVGLVFIPLAYTASLFSMADPYAPGKEGFWIYFAVSCPLIMFVISAYYILDLGYGANGSAWSVRNLWRRMAGEGSEPFTARRPDVELQ